MRIVLLGIAAAAVAIALAFMQSDPGICALYRNSAVSGEGAKARIHIATFDSTDDADYNWQNCQLASTLFQQQPGVNTKFWCEKGRFRSSRGRLGLRGDTHSGAGRFPCRPEFAASRSPD